MQKIKSLVEARKEFSTQIKCEEHLTRMRWTDGVICPRCGAKHLTYLQFRRKWQCECRYQFSVTAGTVFHKTHIDLPRCMMAVWLMCHSPKGVSSKQIERELGVTYKTAWYMTKRIRKAMIQDRLGVKLSGIVEIDDAVVKSDRGKRWDGGSYLVGIASRDGDIRLAILNKLKGEEINRVVRRTSNTCKRSILMGTKSTRGYTNLDFTNTLFIKKQWVDGKVHVSFVENAWSLFKRGLVGIFHHVSTKYLQDYLDEFAFPYSHRHEKRRLMDLVLANCADYTSV